MEKFILNFTHTSKQNLIFRVDYCDIKPYASFLAGFLLFSNPLTSLKIHP